MSLSRCRDREASAKKESMHYNGDYYLTLLEEKHQPKLAYKENVDFEEWRLSVADKLKEVLGIAVIEENACPMNVRIIEENKKDGYKQIHFAFETEMGASKCG